MRPSICTPAQDGYVNTKSSVDINLHVCNSNISYTPKEVVYNFSSYVLSQEEHEALSYGLEHHTPSKVTRNSVNTEFESFYQSLLLDISTIPEESIAE